LAPPVSGGTPPTCWATSSATRERWPYAARRRRGEPTSTAFVESAVNEVVAERMKKAP
jgi:hypothetical protein